MNSPRRRALLGAVGLSAFGFSAGCLQDGIPVGEGTTPEPPQSGSGARTTPDPRYANDLFLKNETNEDCLVDVRVTRDEDGDGEVAGGTDSEDAEGPGSEDAGGADSEDADGAVVAGRYDVPSSAKLELPNVGAVGDRYVVAARFPDAEWRTFAWLVSDCEAYHTPTEDPERTPADDPTLNTDAAVLATDEGLEFGRNSCDGVFVEERGAVPASEHRVGDDSTDTSA